MLNNLIENRKLPPLKSRGEMMNILYREEYGFLPPSPVNMKWEIADSIENYCAGKAVYNKVILKIQLETGRFEFPIYTVIPKKAVRHPFFIHINFRDCVPDRYMPTEELIDNGFAVISFSYKDVTSDDGDFTNGLAGVLYKDGKRGPADAGKIAMWAWAASRAMDYAEGIDNLDLSRGVVCGHSRLGKTALLAAASDERFVCGYSNNSGCGGAALTRNKIGEQPRNIWKSFPYWFCENYGKYTENPAEMPFDQHYLLAGIAPRRAYAASALEDEWADPNSEFLCCAAASEAFEQAGVPGFLCENRLPKPGDRCHDGNIGYHLRAGTHYFSREDWIIFIDYFKKVIDK